MVMSSSISPVFVCFYAPYGTFFVLTCESFYASFILDSVWAAERDSNQFFHLDIVLQSEIVTNSSWAFEVRLARVYTRAVFGRFEESMKSATAFRIVEDPDRGRHSWLVKHTSTSGKIVWGQHQFRVTVNEETGLLACECKQWEHTRMLYILLCLCSLLFTQNF